MSVTVSEQLPLLAAAPNGIKKLRELILELAVRGKLVPQETGDEPASELLKRIAVEKMRKRSGKSSARADEEPQFDVPAGWEWVRFGEIAQHNAGKTLDRGRSHGVLRDYITTSNLYWGYFALENVRQMAIRDEEVERCTARKDDLLICEGGEAGRAAVWEEDREICFQNHIHRARFYGCISPRYAYRVLERLNATGEINRFRKGVAISNMSGKALASIPFPLPPLAEQRRIAAKIDELMALCDRLEAQQADAESAHAQLVATLLDSLTRASDSDDFAASWQRLSAHLHTLFTTESSIDAVKQTLLQLAVRGRLVPQDPTDEPASQLLNRIRADKKKLISRGKLKESPAIADENGPYSLPKGWVWARAEQVSLVIVDCPHSTPKFVRSGRLCLDTNSFKQGNLIEHRLRYVDEATFKARNARLTPEPGDIVFAREGIVGESIVIPDGVACCLGQRVMLFRPASVRSDYLRLSISEPSALKRMLALHKGIGAKHVNVGDMRAALIPLPPLAEQRRIVAKVDELMALCDQLKSRIRQARDLNQQLASTLVERAVA